MKIKVKDKPCTDGYHDYEQAKYSHEYDSGFIGKGCSTKTEFRDYIFCTKCGLVKKLI